MRQLTIALALAIITGNVALASTEAEPQQAVEVKGIRNPLLKPYKVMVAGLDAFDEYHALAPQAEKLRFKLRPRDPAESGTMNNLSLRLAGDTQSLELPIDDAFTFELPRNQPLLDDNADLELNKPKTGYRWQPDIHSAGVPQGMRRVGDLRLECEVLVNVAKKEIGFLRTAFVNSFLLSGDWCNHKSLDMPTIVTRKLASATLLVGDKRSTLALAENGMGYMAPLRDKSVPNEALIELQYAE